MNFRWSGRGVGDRDLRCDRFSPTRRMWTGLNKLQILAPIPEAVPCPSWLKTYAATNDACARCLKLLRLMVAVVACRKRFPLRLWVAPPSKCRERLLAFRGFVQSDWSLTHGSLHSHVLIKSQWYLQDSAENKSRSVQEAHIGSDCGMPSTSRFTRIWRICHLIRAFEMRVLACCQTPSPRGGRPKRLGLTGCSGFSV